MGTDRTGDAFRANKAELERLRRIEAAAEGFVYKRDYAQTDEARLAALRAALAPEGSAGTWTDDRTSEERVMDAAWGRLQAPDPDPTIGMRIVKCPHCGEELSVWPVAEGSARDGG